MPAEIAIVLKASLFIAQQLWKAEFNMPAESAIVQCLVFGRKTSILKPHVASGVLDLSLQCVSLQNDEQ